MKDVICDFVGNEIKVGNTVLFHPKGLTSVSYHLAIGTVTRITAKTVFIEYEREGIDKGMRWNKTKVGMKEYPRRFDQVYVVVSENES